LNRGRKKNPRIDTAGRQGPSKSGGKGYRGKERKTFKKRSENMRRVEGGWNKAETMGEQKCSGTKGTVRENGASPKPGQNENKRLVFAFRLKGRGEEIGHKLNERNGPGSAQNVLGRRVGKLQEILPSRRGLTLEEGGEKTEKRGGGLAPTREGAGRGGAQNSAGVNREKLGVK